MWLYSYYSTIEGTTDIESLQKWIIEMDQQNVSGDVGTLRSEAMHEGAAFSTESGSGSTPPGDEDANSTIQIMCNDAAQGSVCQIDVDLLRCTFEIQIQPSRP